MDFVDVPWLAAEGAALAGSGTPLRPLIVGGSGALGSNLLVLLAHAPECQRIVVLDRRPPSPALLANVTGGLGKKVDFVEHHVGTHGAEELARAMENVDCVFSVVTPDVQFATKKDFYATNAEGVQAIVNACLTAGVPRLVHMSSIAVTNHFVDSCNWSEVDPLPLLGEYTSPYDHSKRLGEEAVLGAARAGTLSACVLRSGGILSSPGDFLFRFACRFPGIVIAPSRSSSKDGDYIDVRDVCRALFMAAKSLSKQGAGVSGEVFYITKGQTWRHQDFCQVVANHLGYPLIPISHAVFVLARISAGLGYYARRALGLKVPGIPPQVFITMCYFEKTFDNSKAKRVLGFDPKVAPMDTLKRIAALRLQAEGYFWSHFWAWSRLGLGLGSLCLGCAAISLSVKARRLRS